MGIDEAALRDIESAVSNAASLSVLGELKAKYPRLAWLRCDASDVLEAPYRQTAIIDLHLIGGGKHCPEVVADPSQATGFIIAARQAKP
jgi:hypothetical protein